MSSLGTVAIVVPNDGLGHAEEALRQKVIVTYFQTLLEAELLPAAILFYTQGVKLAAEGSPCLEALRDLEARGVRLIVCRTGLDFYGQDPAAPPAGGGVGQFQTRSGCIRAAGHRQRCGAEDNGLALHSPESTPTLQDSAARQASSKELADGKLSRSPGIGAGPCSMFTHSALALARIPSTL
jgi:hypothetical protein